MQVVDEKINCIHDLKRDTFTFIFPSFCLLPSRTWRALHECVRVRVLSAAEERHILSIIIFNCQHYKGERENVLHSDINHIHSSRQLTMQQHEICWRATSQFNCLTFFRSQRSFIGDCNFSDFYFWHCCIKKGRFDAWRWYFCTRSLDKPLINRFTARNIVLLKILISCMWNIKIFN